HRLRRLFSAWRLEVGQLLRFILPAAPFFFSAALFVVLPFALIVLYARRFQRGFTSVAQRLGVRRSFAIMALVVPAVAGTFLLCIRQPQRRAFALLDHEPATDADRRALL